MPANWHIYDPLTLHNICLRINFPRKLIPIFPRARLIYTSDFQSHELAVQVSAKRLQPECNRFLDHSNIHASNNHEIPFASRVKIRLI